MTFFLIPETGRGYVLGGIDFTSFYDFSNVFWKCSEMFWYFLAFHCIIQVIHVHVHEYYLQIHLSLTYLFISSNIDLEKLLIYSMIFSICII
jgi:hypothetical protein